MNNAVKLLCRNCRTKLDFSELEPFTQVPCPICGTDLRVPMLFGEYLLEKPCGKGGMSIIYRAFDRDRKNRIALKILQKEYLHEDPMGTRYINGQTMVAKIAHPGIVPVYDSGICDSLPYMAMMYMDNGSLGDHLRSNKRFSTREICGWMATIAEALAAAHELQIVHHDLKPANILLSHSGEVRLGDFDLADIREKGDMRPVDNSWASPAYASPERIAYGGEDHRGDIFSFGVTLYELFTGFLPFSGNSNDPDQLLAQRREQDFDSLYEVRRDIPLELSILVTRMLRYLPETRPDYDEIIRILRNMEQSADLEN